MTVLTTLQEINNHFSKLMDEGQSCNYTYGLDVEFTNCLESKQVINTIQIAYNSNIEDVIIVFFELDANFQSPLKKLLATKANSLVNFLNSRKYVKVGVNIIDDIAKIDRELHTRTLNYIDIQSLAASLNVNKCSMNDLGELFVPDFVPKAKPGGGYLSLDRKRINYIATDAINSLVIYYHILNASKNFFEIMQQKKITITIDEETIIFAEEFFKRINRVRFEGFVNHMHSCHSKWCKFLSKDEAKELSKKLITEMVRRKIVIHSKGFYQHSSKLYKILMRLEL